jgi:hypothetical protein
MRGYWKFKEEELDGTVLRTVFGSGCGSVVRETKMNEYNIWRMSLPHFLGKFLPLSI